MDDYQDPWTSTTTPLCHSRFKEVLEAVARELGGFLTDEDTASALKKARDTNRCSEVITF